MDEEKLSSLKEALKLKSIKSDEANVTPQSRDVKVSFLQGVPGCQVSSAARAGCSSPMGLFLLFFFADLMKPD